MIQDADLFDRDKALKCFGNETILREVLKQFLTEVDPMAQPASRARVRRARVRTQEAFGLDGAPEGYVLLDSPAAIIRPED